MTFVNNTPAPPALTAPVIDYTSRDYASVYADLLARIPLYLPAWTSQSPNDFGIVLLQMFSYSVDLISYYLDRLAGEAFIQTATQAVSILNLAAMLDYTPTLSEGSTVTLQITIGGTVAGPVLIPAGTAFSTAASAAQPAIVFQTTQDLTIAGASAATPSFVGTVPAVQGVTQSNEAVGTSDGTINQTYPLLFNPVSAGSFNVMVDIGLGPQLWAFVPALINSGPSDQVFTNFVDADGTFYIIFGDNVNGFVPPLGSPITCTYQTSSGSLGNVGAGTITQPLTALIGVTAVTNPVAASGGADPESLTSIQQNAPASLKALNRAVTTDDFGTLAIQVAGVQWASAAEVTYQLVNLYIAPFGGGTPSASLVDAVQTYINPLSMANTTVTILPPTYIPINITVNVTALPNFGNSAVQQSVATALAQLLALTGTGFGFRVSLGLVYLILQATSGVNYAAVTAMNRQVLVTTTATISGAGNISLPVSALPQSVSAGDTIILTSTDLVPHSQTLTASGFAAAGATSISVNSFTAVGGSYLAGSSVQDTTGVNDCVLLGNEIPVAGTFTINVTGGVLGS